ncbi:MAG: NAD-dependent epimerase/dehydratase family protein [Acidobacteriota bacterium]
MPVPQLDQVPVLVTGGAGFIGSHLVDRLLELGAEVRVFDDFSTGLRSNLAHLAADAIDVQEGDLRDLDACRRAVAGRQYVFHQAALGSVPRSVAEPATSLAVNAGGTANLFHAARDAGVRRLVYASSSSVYGSSPTLPKREAEVGDVLSPYALSKKMCEQLAEVFGRCYQLEIIGLRYFNVYGPRQRPDGPYAAVIPRFFDAYFSGGRPVIYGDGEQSRDFTFVGDAVLANLLSIGAPAAACGRAYNVAGGKRTSLNQLWRLIRDLADGAGDPTYEPPRQGDVRHSLADLSAIEGQIGYRPETPIDEGLALTSDHFKALSGGA